VGAGTYKESWEQFSRLRTGFFAWSLGGPLPVVAGGLLVDTSRWPDALPPPPVVACAYLAVCAIAVISFYFRLTFFRCPRCRGFFQSRAGKGGGSSWLPRSSCGRCGLASYEDG